MVALPLALLLTLAAAPATCSTGAVAVLPLETVALPRPEAREVEEALRRALAVEAGACVQPREATLTRLRARGGLPEACRERACAGAQLEALGAGWVLRGTALGVGGTRTVALALLGPSGEVGRRTVALGEAPGALEAAVGALWHERGVAAVRRGPRPWPTVMLVAGGAALAAGVGVGLAARATETRLSQPGACPGTGEAFRSCMETQLRTGKDRARAANVLLGAGALLGAGGGLWLLWELP